MVVQEAIGWQTKSPVPGVGYHKQSYLKMDSRPPHGIVFYPCLLSRSMERWEVGTRKYIEAALHSTVIETSNQKTIMHL